MPTDGGCEIIVHRASGEIRVLRTTDIAILSAIVGRESAQKPPPGYNHLLQKFKVSVRHAYRLDKGIVVLADDGRLAGDLFEFGVELAQDFGKEAPDVGVGIATQFLVHLIKAKLGQDADMQHLRDGLYRAMHVQPPDAEPLRKRLRGYIAASEFPRQSRLRFSNLFGGG